MNQIQTDVSETSSIFRKVVESVAEAEETKPAELVPPLFQVIDPDALESLFASDQALGKVIFNYNGHEVSVFSEGYVSVKSHVTRPQSLRE